MTRPTLQDDAQAILDHCGPDTPRDHIAWAAGTTLLDKAFWFERIPILDTKLPGWGYCSTRHRSFNCDRRGFHLFAETWLGPLAVPVVKWAEISALVTLDLIGDGLHQQIVAVVAEQRAYACMRATSWDDLLAESQTLAEQVWRRCRPGVTRQLDLLDLIGAGAR